MSSSSFTKTSAKIFVYFLKNIKGQATAIVIATVQGAEASKVQLYLEGLEFLQTQCICFSTLHINNCKHAPSHLDTSLGT